MTYRIGFSRATSKWSVFSLLIRLVEKRAYSHAYVRLNDPYTGRDIVMQASGLLVNRCNYDVFLEKETVVKEYEVPCTEDQFKEAYTWLSDELGKPYSLLQIWWISIRKLFHVPTKRVNGQSAFICSELAARTLKFQGVKLGESPDEITPSDLDTILSSGGFKLVALT